MSDLIEGSEYAWHRNGKSRDRRDAEDLEAFMTRN